MKIDILSIFFSFSLFSILGWMLEVTYRSPRDRSFVNPGLLKGPYLPLYGTGALLLMVAGSLLFDSNVVTKIFVYFFLTTGLELVSGFIAHHFFAASLWDYSDQRFNFRGHVCLKFSIYWILLAFTFESLILPPFQALFIFLPVAVKVVFVVMVLITMFSDFLAVSMRHLLKMTAAEKALLQKQFCATAKPLLNLPEVASLAQYPHHSGKTRLDHVTEVARLSFLWSQRFNLDEGPRLHGFRHHNIALKNARKITSLSAKEEDIIKRHMWPLTVVPPRYAESLIVSLVDTFCATRDYLQSVKNRITN
ncbi:MAG: putative ABC transporter permease [Deltaproteobacteria bacterium]|nr:putative ABC transporter permease [Deltaproteobacteria bacterium]